MIRRIAQLPLRVVKRALAALDGERSAPSPAPPMNDIPRPSAAPAPTSPPPVGHAPGQGAPADKAAAKKAPAKKAPANKAAAEKAPANKAAAEKSPAKKAAAKKAPAKKAATEKSPAKKAAAKKAAAKKAPAKKAAAKKAPAKKAAPIQVEPMETPNPNAMKFTLNQTVAETGSFSFNAGDAEIAHPVAAAVLALDDVESVFGVNDFITVSKTASADWATLMPKVVEAIQSTA